MNSWRPKDWLVIKQRLCGARCQKCSLDCPADKETESVADALLEALFKLAEQSPTGTFTIDPKVINIYEAKS